MATIIDVAEDGRRITGNGIQCIERKRKCQQ